MGAQPGVREHRAWLQAAGRRWEVSSGQAMLSATRESSHFSCSFPLHKDGAEEAFAFPDSLDAEVIIRSGFADETLVSGEIDSADFDYDSGIISVRGRCKSAKLHQTLTAEKFINQTPDQIVKKLIEKAGLQGDISEEALKAGREWNKDWVRLTDNVSVASVIHKMAEFMGCRWWVDGRGKFHMKRAGESDGTYSVFYEKPAGGPARSDQLTIRVHRNYQASKSIEVNFRSWRQLEKRAYESKKTAPGIGGTTTYEYETPGLTQQHLDRFARSRLAEHVRHEIGLTISGPGDTSCVAGMDLELRGTAFAQKFEIDQVNHSFGMGGHRMTIGATNARKGRSEDGGAGGGGGGFGADVPTPPTRPPDLNGVPLPPSRPAGL